MVFNPLPQTLSHQFDLFFGTQLCGRARRPTPGGALGEGGGTMRFLIQWRSDFYWMILVKATLPTKRPIALGQIIPTKKGFIVVCFWLFLCFSVLSFCATDFDSWGNIWEYVAEQIEGKWSIKETVLTSCHWDPLSTYISGKRQWGWTSMRIWNDITSWWIVENRQTRTTIQTNRILWLLVSNRSIKWLFIPNAGLKQWNDPAKDSGSWGAFSWEYTSKAKSVWHNAPELSVSFLGFPLPFLSKEGGPSRLVLLICRLRPTRPRKTHVGRSCWNQEEASCWGPGHLDALSKRQPSTFLIGTAPILSGAKWPCAIEDTVAMPLVNLVVQQCGTVHPLSCLKPEKNMKKTKRTKTKLYKTIQNREPLNHLEPPMPPNGVNLLKTPATGFLRWAKTPLLWEVMGHHRKVPLGRTRIPGRFGDEQLGMWNVCFPDR